MLNVLLILYNFFIISNIYKLLYIISNMIIYNPYNQKIINERAIEAENILKEIPAKYCFITGSFIYNKNYNDIDVFVVSRTKKKIKLENKKAKITFIDFNNLHSLFYHSVSKSCIAKNILPKKELKVTISDYWNVINEAVPTLLNEKDKFHKNIRFLILYTEYFKSGNILDTFELSQKIKTFLDYKQILEYIKKETPLIIKKNSKKSYARRFLYTWAGRYKELLEYKAQNFLYKLTHIISEGFTHG